MSNPQFHRVIPSYEYETYTFRKELLYDSSLTGNALKLLLIMIDFGKRPGWQLRQNHLMSVCSFKWEKYDNAISCLIDAGYVRRSREKIGDSYEYEFSAFPVFIDENYQNKAHTSFEPVRVSQIGKPNTGNPNLNLSYIDNVLEEATNKQEAQDEILVSSSLEKIEELERTPGLSESQKKTIYSKFPSDRILTALKLVDLSKADCPFALLYSALKKNYQPSQNKEHRNDESYKIYCQAEEYLSRVGSSPISLAIDEKNAYIYHGTAVSKYPLNDASFKEKFSLSINNFMVSHARKETI